MIISVLGYMGCGKTHISKRLSREMNYEFIDLDIIISRKCKLSIPDIFQQKGEMYFRRQERAVLEEILATRSNCILSLGGGTPAYYNNMEVINENSVSFYLQTSIPILSERLLRQKHKRPLIARISDEDLPEFIAKHLFERIPFYSKAQFTINTLGRDSDAIIAEIISRIY